MLDMVGETHNGAEKMSSYKEPPSVTIAYGIQKDVTKPASFIDDSFDAPEVTIVGFCGKMGLGPSAPASLVAR